MRLVFVVMLVLLATPASTYAQSFTLSGGITSPMGDFGDDRGSDAGGAVLGPAVAATFATPVATNLYWSLSASLNVNGTDEDALTRGVVGGPGVLDVDTGYYINAPLMTGLRYQGDVSPGLALFGGAEVGVNVSRSPSVEMDFSLDYCDYWGCTTTSAQADMDPATALSFGYGVLGGLVINDKVEVALRYLDLGKPKFETEMYMSYGLDSMEEEVKFKQPISLLQLLVGIRF